MPDTFSHTRTVGHLPIPKVFPSRRLRTAAARAEHKKLQLERLSVPPMLPL